MKKLFRPASGSILFLALISIELFWVFYFVIGRRMPIDHDGLTHFLLQYSFLNATATYNEIPLWTPFMTHGTTMTWWYTLQGVVGILPSALMLLGKWIHSWNFLPLFYSGLFVDKMILLVGTWLLAREYFRSPLTRFFVASCVLGSTIALTQFKFTLYLFYAIPLILYFLHQFLKGGEWRWLFLAFSLFVMQAIGNDGYFLPVSSFAIASYLAFLIAPSVWQRNFPRLRWNKSLGIYILLAVILGTALVALFHYGKDAQLVYNNEDRLGDGSVSLETFLTYGGNTSLHKWGELFLRTSPTFDYTLYIGFLALPLIALGTLFGGGKEKFPVLATTAVLLLFVSATPFTKFVYHAWPLMKFYRHLCLVAPLIKLFFCFLAGFGFEAVFQTVEKPKKYFHIFFCVFSALLLLTTSVVLFRLAQDPALAQKTINALVQGWLPTFGPIPPTVLTRHLLFSAACVLTLTLLLIVFAIAGQKKYSALILGMILIVHGLDIYSYAFSESRRRSAMLSIEEYRLLAFQPIPYPPRRDSKTLSQNPRNGILRHHLPNAALYATANNFFFMDHPGSPYRADHWQKGFDRLMRTYQGLPLDDPGTVLRQPWRGIIEFPSGNPAAAKIAGITEDKIQFFSKGIMLSSPRLTAAYLAAPHFSGDILFYQKPGSDEEALATSFQERFDLFDNDRLDLDYTVIAFNPNQIKIEVENPQPDGAWLLYSDCWHPYWKCRINGEPVPVFIGNLAYKAVPLKAGKNIVHFYFECLPLVWLYRFFMMNAVVWLVILGWLFRICLKDEKGVTSP